MRRALSIICMLLVLFSSVLAPVGVGLADASSASAADSPTSKVSTDSGSKTIDITYGVQLRPDDPSRLEVRTTVSFPSGVSAFTFSNPPDGFELRQRDGFIRKKNDRIAWNGRSDPATMTYTVPRNRTGSFDELGSAGEGEWAFVNRDLVDFRFQYRYSGRQPTWFETIEPVGAGYGSVSLAVLGEHEVHGGEDEGFRVVVPDAASPGYDPDEIIDVLRTARDDLAVGSENRVVDVFVAPDPIRRGGLAPQLERHGRQNVWVYHHSSMSGPQNTWIHEYVHTRQEFRLGEEMQWFTEGSADYYAGLLALHQNRTAFDRFRGEMTSTKDPVVLADEETWNGAPYAQGRQTLAVLDTKIRRSSDNESTLLDVFDRMNEREETISYETFSDIVVDVSGDESLSEWLDRTVHSRDVPHPPADPSLYVQPDGVGDSDDDGLPDTRELELGTHPFRADTDGDGLLDTEELDRGTDPRLKDTDGDGVADGVELDVGTDPLREDTDGDGLSDGTERSLDADPLLEDTDDDGLSDADELERGTNPSTGDTDGDGLSDGTEIELGTDPLETDTDGDGRSDGEEVERGTDPLRSEDRTEPGDADGSRAGEEDIANEMPGVGFFGTAVTIGGAVSLFARRSTETE